MFYVYMIENKINCKKYIGKTNNPKVRWRSYIYTAKSLKYNVQIMHLAMNKYGVDNFTFSIIESNEDEEFIFNREKYWIKKYNTVKSGYNVTYGGKGGRSGTKVSDETKQKISLANTGNTHSDETKEKISQLKKGKAPPNKGVSMSEDQKKLLSDIFIEKFKDKNNHPRFGKSKISNDEKDETYCMYLDGISQVKLANYYKVSTKTIYNILRKYRDEES